jgi:hypothetical protein
MKRINWLFTVSSLNVLLVTIERFSFTTKVVLQPHSFLRLHELVQIIVLILATIIIPTFLFKELSRNFEALKTQKGQWIGLLFIIGIYFYATGNGLHEVSSFFVNQYCDIKHLTSDLCHGLFINDYYTGNIFYFVGAMMSNIALILLELNYPVENWNRKDYIILAINSVVYAFAIVAYASIDPVLVGIIFSSITLVLVYGILIYARKNIKKLPFTLYCGIAYTLGTVVAFYVRFFVLHT